VSHGVAAASTLEPLELAQLPPSQLPQLGKVVRVTVTVRVRVRVS